MILDLKNLSFIKNKKTLIKNFSFSFKQGNLYGILGPNGAGKSTLLKIISQLWKPTQGEIFWNNKNFKDCSRLEMSQIISCVPQNPNVQFDFSCLELVQMGLYARPLSSKVFDSVEQALTQVDAWHLRHKNLSELSGGEKQRIFIARALVTDAPVILFDEPTTHLDLRHQLEIWQLLQQLAQQGKLPIVIAHDIQRAKHYCNELLIIHEGHLYQSGLSKNVLTSQVLENIFGLTNSLLLSSFS
ncbi:MAG: ABC transporter ATP-binding protein [Parachlamydiaceae bacterium]|nr:ABC transporter ATP-binding protein [Parachlamydiaceae bacterium]